MKARIGPTAAVPYQARAVTRPVGHTANGLVPLQLYGLRRRTVNLVTLACGLFALFTLVPIWWVVVNSTKTGVNINSTFGFSFARPFVLFRNVHDVFTNTESGSFLDWTKNSAIYASAGAAGATVLSAMAGYGFAQFNFRGKNALFLFAMGPVLVPETVFAIPLFLLYAKLRLVSTMPGMVIPFIVSPITLYMMRVYIRIMVPRELIDAARVDGAGEARIFARIAVPLIVAPLVTVFMLNFVSAWNEFFLPFILNNNPNLNPLTVGLATWMSPVAGPSQDQTAMVVTAAMLSIVPPITMFLVLQRYLRGGLLLGAITK